MHLSHPWCDTPVQVGDPVNVIDGVITSSSSGVPHVYLDHRQGLLVLHPDVLLSGESAMTSLSRRSGLHHIGSQILPPEWA